MKIKQTILLIMIGSISFIQPAFCEGLDSVSPAWTMENTEPSKELKIKHEISSRIAAQNSSSTSFTGAALAVGQNSIFIAPGASVGFAYINVKGDTVGVFDSK